MGEQNLAARDTLSCERVGLEPMLGVGKLAQNPVEEQQNLFDASFGVEQLGQTRFRANPQLEQKAWLTGFSAPLLVQVAKPTPSTGDRLSGLVLAALTVSAAEPGRRLRLPNPRAVRQARGGR